MLTWIVDSVGLIKCYISFETPTQFQPLLLLCKYLWKEMNFGAEWVRARWRIANANEMFLCIFRPENGKNPFTFFFFRINGKIGNNKPNHDKYINWQKTDIFGECSKGKDVSAYTIQYTVHPGDNEMSYLGWRLDGLIACVHAWLYWWSKRMLRRASRPQK